VTTRCKHEQVSSFNRQRSYFLEHYCERPADELLVAFERELDFGVCMMFRCLAIVHANQQEQQLGSPSWTKPPLLPALMKHLSRRKLRSEHTSEVRARRVCRVSH
jgi:hypothetical protein